jgi:hypothetical protein
MADSADEQLARIAEALGVSPDDVLRAALEQRFAEQADAEAARSYARRLEDPDEWEGELDEPELWSETLEEQTSEDDELDLWWRDPPSIE